MVSSRPSVDIKISNDSTNDLTWVYVRWDEVEEYGAGVLPPGVSSVSLYDTLPKTPKSDIAFVEFVDAKDGWTGRDNSKRKTYQIPLNVSALKRLSTGHYVVTFSILSFTKASLQIKIKEEDK